MGRRVPWVKTPIERFLGLPDGEGQVQELAHGVADGDGFLVGMFGDDTCVEGAHGGVVAHGAEGGHPEVATHQVVATPGHDVAFGNARLAIAIDAGADLDGHDAEVGDELVGRLEAVDVANEGGEDGGGDCADAGNGVEMVWVGKLTIRVHQGFFQAQLACAHVAQLTHLVAHEFGMVSSWSEAMESRACSRSVLISLSGR